MVAVADGFRCPAWRCQRASVNIAQCSILSRRTPLEGPEAFQRGGCCSAVGWRYGGAAFGFWFNSSICLAPCEGIWEPLVGRSSMRPSWGGRAPAATG